jgi:phosphopantetheine binding protein/AMP-binding enzyme
VLLREYGPDDRRLVAYIVPSGAETPTTSDLRAFIARRLPDFMLPAAFIAVDEFPLTPNGKIDRRRLPEPTSQGRPDPGAVFVAPRTAAEQLVAGVYRDVLRVDRVGANDDFFERGGHSLLATQAIVRIREAFGIDVPLRTLFERPTTAGMVLALADLLGDRTTLDEIAGAILEVNQLSDAEVRARLTAEAAASTFDESPASTVA